MTGTSRTAILLMSLCGFNTWPSLEKVGSHRAAVPSCVWCFHSDPVMLWIPVLLMSTWIVAPGHCCPVLSLLPALCLLSVDMLFTVVGHVYCLLTHCLLLWVMSALCWHAVYCCGPCLLSVDMLFIVVGCVYCLLTWCLLLWAVSTVCWHAVLLLWAV